MVYFRYYDSPPMCHGSLERVMGTRFDILMTGIQKSGATALWQAITDALFRWDKMLNRFDPESEIAFINRRASEKAVIVSDELWVMLQHCRLYHRQTGGLFDITLKNFSGVIFSEKEKMLFFSQSGMQLDLGGYAKGFALKKIKVMLLDAGVEHALIDFGNSSILGMGHHPYGEAWKVSVNNPYFPQQQLCEIVLKNEALSVSGNTPSYFGHIIHPLSGKACKAAQLVAAVSDDPLDAEVLSTVFMIADVKQKKQLKKDFHIQGLFEYKELQKE